MTFDQEITSYTSQGWRITSDGPSGVQLEGPKKMSRNGKGAVIFGIVMLFLFWPIGLLLILAAVIDHAAFTKPETKFLKR